jgi:hypothetical protein
MRRNADIGLSTKPATLDDPVKSQLWDSFGKRPRSRLANPEEGGVLPVRRSDEG